MPRNCRTCKQELSPLCPHTCHANTCKLCQKPLRTRNEFEVHMMRLHCSETACQFCGVKLASTPNLIYHLKSHTSLRFDEVIECYSGFYIFMSRYPAFKCSKCGLRFRSEATMSQHECQPISSPESSPTKEQKDHSFSDKMDRR